MNGSKTATNRRNVGPTPAPAALANTVAPAANPLAPEGATELANPARRTGLRQLVKARLCTAAEALGWLQRTDPNPNPRIVLWLEKKARKDPES